MHVHVRGPVAHVHDLRRLFLFLLLLLVRLLRTPFTGFGVWVVKEEFARLRRGKLPGAVRRIHGIPARQRRTRRRCQRRLAAQRRRRLNRLRVDRRGRRGDLNLCRLMNRLVRDGPGRRRSAFRFLDVEPLVRLHRRREFRVDIHELVIFVVLFSEVVRRASFRGDSNQSFGVFEQSRLRDAKFMRQRHRVERLRRPRVAPPAGSLRLRVLDHRGRHVGDARHQRGLARGYLEAPDAAALLRRREKKRAVAVDGYRRGPRGDAGRPGLTQRAPLQQRPAGYLHHRERSLRHRQDARRSERVQAAELPLFNFNLRVGYGLGSAGSPGRLGHVRLQRRLHRALWCLVAAIQPRLRDPQAPPGPRREHPLRAGRCIQFGGGVASGSGVEAAAVRTLPRLAPDFWVHAGRDGE